MNKVDAFKKVEYFFILGIILISCNKEKPNDDNKPINPSSVFIIEKSDLPKLEKEALLGSSEAAFKLYQFYGFYILDYNKSLYWVQIAAENGHVIGQHNLAYLLYNTSDINNKLRAKYWAKKSALNGNKEADEFLKEMESK